MSERAYGIPTKYKARQYRSRLEARWAAMFDLLKWHVEYEPCDFNGWIPDFVIQEYQNTFVEVKPLCVSHEPGLVIQKIDRSGCGDECLIVGMALYEYYGPGNPLFGWLREGAAEAEGEWAAAVMGRWRSSKQESKARLRTDPPTEVIGFCHSSRSFRDRITGGYDGGSFGSELAADAWDLWAEAGNLVQWRRSTQ